MHNYRHRELFEPPLDAFMHRNHWQDLRSPTCSERRPRYARTWEKAGWSRAVTATS